mmetsp:Transcript_36209/g.84890  ORF Transcript_36209/g.84890 Transcript_36209/m.84890 type:complete len:390 (+) Transcript_36209:1027-2196(+)
MVLEVDFLRVGGDAAIKDILVGRKHRPDRGRQLRRQRGRCLASNRLLDLVPGLLELANLHQEVCTGDIHDPLEELLEVVPASLLRGHGSLELRLLGSDHVANLRHRRTLALAGGILELLLKVPHLRGLGFSGSTQGGDGLVEVQDGRVERTKAELLHRAGHALQSIRRHAGANSLKDVSGGLLLHGIPCSHPNQPLGERVEQRLTPSVRGDAGATLEHEPEKIAVAASQSDGDRRLPLELSFVRSAAHIGFGCTQDFQRLIQLRIAGGTAGVGCEADGQVTLAVGQVDIGPPFLNQGFQKDLPAPSHSSSQGDTGAREKRAALVIQVVWLNGAFRHVPGSQGGVALQQRHVDGRIPPLVLHVRIVAALHQHVCQVLPAIGKGVMQRAVS